jgi:anti-anti-sigma regulatory factor
MTTTIERIVIASALGDSHPALQPDTVVLQPNGALSQDNSSAFQQALEEALEQAAAAVIVDFLWVSSTDLHGVAVLVAGIQRAANLGKFLSFQAMDSRTRAAVEVEWNRQRDRMFGSWSSLFQNDLEQFLGKGMKQGLKRG